MEQRCRECIYKKNINRYPKEADPDLIRRYKEAVSGLLKTCPDKLTAPEAADQIRDFRKDLFQEVPEDYTDIKKHYNALLLDREEALLKETEAAAASMCFISLCANAISLRSASTFLSSAESLLPNVILPDPLYISPLL